MLARCRLCGAAGVHRQCGRLETVANWACEPCLLVEKKGMYIEIQLKLIWNGLVCTANSNILVVVLNS